MRLQVIVLSDNESRTKRFVQFLHELEVATKTASSPAEVTALARLAASIILFDVDFFKWPASDVFEVSIALSIPVIVIVGQFDTPQWIDFVKKGASEVLRDPVSKRDLQLSITSTLPQLQWSSGGK